MRIVIAFSLICGVAFVAPTVVSAAPLNLSNHAAVTKSLGAANADVKEAGWRRKARRCGRRYARAAWTCQPYWRPYQYQYWDYYYPYGGPLF